MMQQHGATGFDALHGATQHNHHDNAVNLAKHDIKGHKQDKAAINKVLTLILQQKEECAEAYIAACKGRAGNSSSGMICDQCD
jgi:Asp/Glu/hydantoin racemase